MISGFWEDIISEHLNICLKHLNCIVAEEESVWSGELFKSNVLVLKMCFGEIFIYMAEPGSVFFLFNFFKILLQLKMLCTIAVHQL